MEIVKVDYHTDDIMTMNGIEVMPNTLTFSNGTTETRYGILALPLDKSLNEVTDLLKTLVATGNKYSIQSHTPKEIKACYRAGFRGYEGGTQEKRTKEKEHLAQLDACVSIYMDVN